MELWQFVQRLSEVATAEQRAITIEAFVDTHDGEEHRCPIMDVLWDGETVVVCVDGTDLGRRGRGQGGKQ